ncbi:MAG: hypothetical protein QGI33_02490 [Candidatus Brocadiia bacterium]|nr:hypothetical protein [Candidatus Brocadiia bacterium]
MSRKCQNCRTLWQESDRFCGRCGAPLDKKPPLRSPAPRAPAEESLGTGMRMLLWLLELVPGVISPTVIVCSILTLGMSGGCFCTALMLLQFHLIFATFAAGAGGVLLYWTALCWMLYGHVCAPVEAMAEFQSKHWMVLVGMTVAPIGLLFWLAGVLQAAGKLG